MEKIKEILVKILKSKILYIILGVILVFCVFFFVILPKINENKIDEMWRTDRITISLSDGNSFDVESSEMVLRIQKYCNDGLFRSVDSENRVDGSCGIWVDFNNGTVIGMFPTRDYGYVGDTKQYIGDPSYLPSGFNEFIRNLVSLNVNFHTLTGDITEIYKLGYILSLDEESKKITDVDTIFASSENMVFSEIKEMDFNIGDTVLVYYNGEVIDSYPAQIYMSKIELVESVSDKIKAQVTPVLRQEDKDEGYEVKHSEEDTSSYKFKQIKYNDSFISNIIPDWVMNESSINGLYSINNIDLLVDIVAGDEFKNNLGSKWTTEQKEAVYLGQGMKCFNLDNDRIFYYYPMVLNGNIVGLLELEEVDNSEYYASFTIEFVNALNEISKQTSQNNPLILLRYQNNICGLIDETIYSENDLNIKGINIPEITRSTIIDVLEKLDTNDDFEEVEENDSNTENEEDSDNTDDENLEDEDDSNTRELNEFSSQNTDIESDNLDETGGAYIN